MKNIIQPLDTFSLLQYTLSLVIQKLLSPIREYKIDDVSDQIAASHLQDFTVDDNVLTIVLSYDKNSQTMFNTIGCATYRSNKFLLVVKNIKGNDQNILSLDFIDHQFDAVIDEVLNEKTYDSLPKGLQNYLSELEFNIPIKYQRRDYPFVIEPLSKKYLYEAMRLQHTIFPDMSDTEKLTLPASLSKKRYENVYIEERIKSMQYWVAIDLATSHIIGLTGLYDEVDDSEDECWLGWFCMDDKYRGNGYGKKLLEFSEEQAKALKKKTLHIYSYKRKKYLKAIELYKKFGYKENLAKETKYTQDLYFKKELC